jgi:hypothetical protein
MDDELENAAAAAAAAIPKTDMVDYDDEQDRE